MYYRHGMYEYPYTSTYVPVYYRYGMHAYPYKYNNILCLFRPPGPQMALKAANIITADKCYQIQLCLCTEVDPKIYINHEKCLG